MRDISLLLHIMPGWIDFDFFAVLCALYTPFCVCHLQAAALFLCYLHLSPPLPLSLFSCFPPSVIFARWYCAHLIFIYINAMFSLFCCFRPAVWITQALLIAPHCSPPPLPFSFPPATEAACLSAHLPHSSPLCSVVDAGKSVCDLTMCGNGAQL